jgi:enamidase
MVRRAGWTDQDYPAFRAGRPKQDLFLRLFAAAGGRVATGTDASNQMLIPGYSEHRELELLVGAGFSPRDALLAGTRNGALLLGVDSLGILAPGKAADLVILTRDPLGDIRHTLAIDRVMSRGLLLSADSIRKAW